ncbi:MAG: glycosyltransferase [Actinomycetota bacterium]
MSAPRPPAPTGRVAPLVSVVTAVHDPEPAHLRECLASVADQTWSHRVEHVLVDDGSTSTEIVELLDEVAAADRTTVIRRPESGGIVAATNDGLTAATGEWIAFLDHDDLLEPDAIEAIVTAADAAEADVAYSDHDFLRSDGRFVDPCYKPDWSPERLRNQNYVTHLVVARRDAIERVGGLRTGTDGAQDHDLILRLGEVSSSIVHVPRVLYHWRQAPTSVAGGSDAKPWAFDAGVRVVRDHCERIGLGATVERTDHEGVYRVAHRHAVAARGDSGESMPLVSVVVPTRGTSGRVWGATRCFVVEAIRSIVEMSTYTHLEFVVVADDVTPDPVLAALADVAGERLRIVETSGPFNFSAKMNRGAAEASGEFLLLLNDDTELVDPGSIDELIGLVTGPAEGPDGAAGAVAMAGARLWFADGTLQHGGHVYHHDLMHACLGWGGEVPGPWPLRPLAVARECSGVTAAAALVRRDVFDRVGGFPADLPLNYNDVDLSLKIRADGHRIVWTPNATWFHFESRTRESRLLDEEYAFINTRWHHEINNDPYYNPNLAPDRSDWLERPLRSGAPALVTRPNVVARIAQRVRNRTS